MEHPRLAALGSSLSQIHVNWAWEGVYSTFALLRLSLLLVQGAKPRAEGLMMATNQVTSVGPAVPGGCEDHTRPLLFLSQNRRENQLTKEQGSPSAGHTDEVMQGRPL